MSKSTKPKYVDLKSAEEILKMLEGEPQEHLKFAIGIAKKSNLKTAYLSPEGQAQVKKRFAKPKRS